MIKRTIKSYVLRAGRTSTRQIQGLEQWLKDYELPIGETPWDVGAVFHRDAPTVVEIGFGMGASLCAMAKNEPETNFIGIEVHRPGLGALAMDLHEAGLTNVRLVAHDAVDVLGRLIPKHALTGIQIFFPDPWPKKRHHKRRLIQPAFVKTLCHALKPNGWIHAATDWEEYAYHMKEVFNAEPALRNQSPDNAFSERPPSRPVTKFERRGERLGHGVWDLLYTKVDEGKI